MRTSFTPLHLLAMLVLLCVLASSTVLAQGITTAAINGKITSKTGEALPGVNVIAVHEPSGTKYGTSTRPDGRYTLPNMRVGGPYTVTASAVGYQKQERTEIYLRLSEILDLDFSLAEQAVVGQEVVIVGERAAVFSASRTGAATSVTRQSIDQLPTLSRNFQDYYKLSPYLSASTASGVAGGNAVGRNAKYNNIQVDGISFNDLFGLGGTGAPAGQSNVTPISLDAIEEFQIVVSPYDVRQAGFTGAGINAITRSGTNQFKGSLFYYGRNENFAGKTPTDVDSLRKKLDGFTDYQIGGRIGGPILEDQFFFFGNGEITRFKQPLTRTFGSRTLGTNVFTVPQDSLNLLVNTLQTKYGYNPGSFSSINFLRESDKAFARLDFNLTESHKLTARWNYLKSLEDNSPSRGRAPTDIYSDFARYTLKNRTHSLALQLTSTFGNSYSNEFTVGYTDQFDNPVYLGQPFPTLYIRTRNNTPGFDNSQQVLVLGAEQFRHFNELGQKYFEFTDNFTFYLQDHTITVGAKVDLFKFRNLFIPSAFGVYTYNSIDEFINDKRPAAYEFRYSATPNPRQEANWGARQYGVYAQDEWTVNPSLRLTAGLRTDIATYPDKPNYNFRIDSTFGFRTDRMPKTHVAFSPRFGFNWALDEARNAQLRGGVGVFYGRFPYVWVSNQYSNTGVDFFTVTAVPQRFNPDPFNQQKLPPTSTTAEVNITDPNFKAPSVVRWSAAVDYKLPWNLVATIEGIFSLTQNDIYYENINLAPNTLNVNNLGTTGPLTPGGRLVGEGREVWGTYSTSTRRFSTRWINARDFAPGVFLIRNTSKGSNSNVIVQLQRTVLEGFGGSVSYTWGMAKDINSGNSATASSGWRFNPTPGNPNNPQLTYSQYDRRHRIVAILTYRHDWGIAGLATSIGLFYNGQSGRPFSYLVVGDVNGDGRSDNDLPYIPRDENDIILVNSAGTVLPKTDAAYAQLFNFINSDPYLRENKGRIAERSGPREPWAHMLDLRISQEIPTIAGQKIELTFDILNLPNLLRPKKWGWVKNTGVNQTFNLIEFHSLETTPGPNYGKPRYRWTNPSTPFQPDNILSRWQAQFGIRYTI